MKTRDLNLLAALDVLLNEESVSAAARRMHLSTPAMSHTLGRIRDALGDPILVRAGRKLVPTPRALALRGPVRKLVADARALLAPGDGADLGEIEREFIVRAPDGISIVFGSAFALALQECMPLASLRFVPETDGDAAALREGRIDLDIGPALDRGPEVEIETLFEQRLVGLVRQGHPLLKGALTLKRFAAQRHVAVASQSRRGGTLESAMAAAGMRRHVQLTVATPYAALMAAARSDLVATVPARLAQSVGTALKLEAFKVPLALPAENIVLAWHPQFAADAAHAWLRKHVAQALRSKDWALPPRPTAAAA